MNQNQFTIKTQEVLSQAQQIAVVNNQQQITPDHILLGLLQSDQKVTDFIFEKQSANIDYIKQVAEQQVKKHPRVEGGSQTHFSNEAIALLEQAQREAGKMKDEYISLEHLILAILQSKGAAGQLLKDQGINEKDTLKAIEELRKGQKVDSQSAEDTYNSLEKYAKNLNQLVREGKIDPIIGRDEEIRRVLQILSRRTKNNPLLIGEPGVGKTAIAEGIAQRIVNGDVPENLKNKTLFSLDMGALVAGAKYKGEFEERLKSVIKEVTQSNGHILLFIDEIHTLVGAGGGGEGAMDAANILKPALARGELRSIGATTLKEYQKYFEKDKALERRFQKVLVEEPDEESAIAILRGIKEKYEVHHKIRIKDEAIVQSVVLSNRYITDRFLPDKAIDLMDEAAARLRMEMDSKPEALDTLDRKITQLEIELEAIKNENDEKRINLVKEELANLNEERDNLNALWKEERGMAEEIQKAKENLDQLKIEAEQMERQGNYERVAEIRYKLVKEEEDKIKALEVKLADRNNTLIKEEVDAEDIAEVVSRWTGIPLNKLMQSEKAKLLHLEDELHQRVVGQDEAIQVIADAIRRNRAGLNDENRPIGSFLFLGPTGVGKTELAKALAELLFDDERALTRIDMSEYQERHSVSRLVGAPPGYVGYDEGGQLTEAVRHRPYSVVLLDEMEKAHPDVFNILLQVLDDGRLTDNKGRTINFKNTIIILTSNFGSSIILEKFADMKAKDEQAVYEDTKKVLLEELKKGFRPEFLNRIDEITVFKPLSENELHDIIAIQIKQLAKKLAEKEITLDATPEAIDYIARLGHDPQFGARPLKRTIQTELLNELSKEILKGEISENDAILVDYFPEKEGDKKLVFRK